jgi:hypothetical protein
VPDTDPALAAERARVVRHFQRYTAEQRTTHAASHRLGHRQRTAIGEHFYTHPDVPGRAFPRRDLAARAGLAAQHPEEHPMSLTLSHTAAEGTLLDGTSKGDGSAEILHASAQNWRWSRNLGCWFVRYSREKPPRLAAIDKDAEALRAAGFEVEVEIDGQPRRYEEAEADRAQHFGERAEHLHGKAERRAAASEAAYRGAKQIMDGIPSGQPILVGHHSERRHRRDLDKIDRGFRKSFELSKEAEDAQRRAELAENHMRYREDPYAMARRLKDRTAKRAKAQRSLDGHSRNFLNGRGEVMYVEEHKPATGTWREQLLLEVAHLDEEIRGLTDALEVAKQEGRYLAVTKDDVKKGQLVKIDGRWYLVDKVNRTTVSVTSFGLSLKYPLDQIRGVKDAPPEVAALAGTEV